MCAILRASVMPPQCDGSGWMMSTAPLAMTALKSQREKSLSPSAIGIGDCYAARVIDGFNEGDRAFGHLAECADDFRMTAVADEQDVQPVRDQALGLTMDFRHQRARRVDISEPAVAGVGRDRLWDAVSGEHDRPVIRNFVELVDEDRAHLLQPVDDEAVVDDFVPYIDRRPEPLERELDDLDCAVDARAETARRGDEDFERRPVKHWDRGHKASLAALEGGSYERAHPIPAS